MVKKFNLALVTGATSGIGAALSHFLAAKGVNLILHGRNAEKLEHMAEGLRGQVQVDTVVADLNFADGRTQVIAAIRGQCPDLVINNAGLGAYGSALSHDIAKELEIFNVNGAAVLELSLEAARALISANRKGTILNVSSAAAWPLSPGMAVYSASKAFVNQFSESFDEETRCHGVRVLVVCPGMVATEFSTRAGATKGRAGQLEAMTPEYVAQQIWNQIQAEDKIKIIDGRYRWLTFLVRYILPKPWTAYFVGKAITEKLHGSNDGNTF